VAIFKFAAGCINRKPKPFSNPAATLRAWTTNIVEDRARLENMSGPAFFLLSFETKLVYFASGDEANCGEAISKLCRHIFENIRHRFSQH
jgi:hypothetical protein